MGLVFTREAPEKSGIPSKCLINMALKLEENQLPMHSITIMRHDKILMDCYYSPYKKGSMHRMFSVTKTLVGLAIGLLIEEGKLSMDDKIITFFPEKLSPCGAHPYLSMLTIRQMLSMQTCHEVNAYKVNHTDDWIGAFFTVEPNHIPGTSFAYDTASTHVLGALVKKLSGMEFLDYLRIKFLDEIGFSKDSFVLPDPSGIPMGGSGLVATSDDLLKVLYVISKNGRIGEKQLLPENFVKEATSLKADTTCKGSCIEEMMGYGYQIWMTRHNGFVLFGMAGQLGLYVPEKDIYMVTTADAMGRAGGVQMIYDAFWDEVYSHIDNPDDSFRLSDSSAYTELLEFENTRELYVLPENESLDNTVADSINGVVYKFDNNVCGISKIRVDLNKKDKKGTLAYTNKTGNHLIEFGFGKNIIQNFPDYDMRCAISASFKSSNTLVIKTQIIDITIGNMYFSLNYVDDKITVVMKKYEESLFNEYNGVFSGTAEVAAL